jgi:hypothetical protein
MGEHILKCWITSLDHLTKIDKQSYNNYQLEHGSFTS